jgi:hypothetical protein
MDEQNSKYPSQMERRTLAASQPLVPHPESPVSDSSPSESASLDAESSLSEVGGSSSVQQIRRLRHATQEERTGELIQICLVPIVQYLPHLLRRFATLAKMRLHLTPSGV